MNKSNAYHFVTEWRIPAPAGAIYDLLVEVEGLPRWWPSVYLGVQQIKIGSEDGIGNVYILDTKGWLPYRLRWSFVVKETVRPVRLALEAMGDFNGMGVWTFSESNGATEVTYDWNIIAAKPLLRNLSFIFKPVFSANHRWAMAQGETSLLAELQRRDLLFTSLNGATG